ADPYGTAEKVGGALAEGFAEPYRPKDGESWTDVAARNVLDRPLGTLMDVSALVGIPAGGLEAAGVTGAKVFADAAHAIDPITLGTAAMKGVLRTAAPDALQAMEASKAITDIASAQKTRAVAEHQAFAAQTADVFDGLSPDEKALFFPYVE